MARINATILSLLMVFVGNASADTVVFDLNGDKFNFSVYRTDLPTITETHTMEIVPQGGPIGPDNGVDFVVDGATMHATCDGSMQYIPGTNPALPSYLTCGVDRSGTIMPGTSVTLTLNYVDPTMVDNAVANPPSNEFPELNRTSATAPFCNSDEYGQACKWQEQNTRADSVLSMAGVPIGYWIVYSRTIINGIRLGYTVQPPGTAVGEYVCTNDSVASGGLWSCALGKVGAMPTHLCPIDAVNCAKKIEAFCTDSQSWIDPDMDQCFKNQGCMFGALTQDNACLYEPDPAKPFCPNGYGGTFDPNGKLICLGSPGCIGPGTVKACLYGLPVMGSDDCRVSSFNGICPDGYAYQTQTGDCLGAKQEIPSLGTPMNLKDKLVCETGEPRCPDDPPDLQYNPIQNGCYPFGQPCPYGNNRPCVQLDGHALEMCSAVDCGMIQLNGVPEGQNDKKNDAGIDENGECLGKIYIYSGHDRRCRSGGVTIGWEDCCKDKDFFFGLGRCRESELELADMKSRALCHYVGPHCSKTLSVPFLGSICIETEKTYCCFNSKLARIVQEQGRAQLKTLSDWGSADNPNCQGFTPDEFQALDFGKMDLSEWFSEIQTISSITLKNKLRDRIDEFYQKTQ